MTWPKGADGDVFRRLEAHGFDFTKQHEIDFEIDFCAWPPSEESIAAVRGVHPNVRICQPDGNYRGYLHLSIMDFVTYDLVVSVQSDMTALVAPFGGACESWGVLHS
jgi:hypothetical protein